MEITFEEKLVRLVCTTKMHPSGHRNGCLVLSSGYWETDPMTRIHLMSGPAGFRVDCRGSFSFRREECDEP